MANSRLIATGNNNNPAIYSTGVLPTSADTVYLNGFNLTIIDDTQGIAGNYSNGANVATGAVQSATSFISTNTNALILNFNIITTVANGNGFLRLTYPNSGQTTWTGGISGIGTFMITYLGTNGTTVVVNVTSWNFTGHGILFAGTNPNSNIILSVPNELNTTCTASGNAGISVNANIIINSSYYKANATNAYFLVNTSPFTGNTQKVNGIVQTNTSAYNSLNHLFDVNIQLTIFQEVDWTNANPYPIRGGANNTKIDSDYADRKIKLNLSNNTTSVFAPDTDPAPEDKVIKGTVYEHGAKEGIYEPVPKEFVSYPYPFGVNETGEAIFTTIID